MRRKCPICALPIVGEPGVWCMRCLRALDKADQDNDMATAEWAAARARKAERARTAVLLRKSKWTAERKPIEIPRKGKR